MNDEPDSGSAAPVIAPQELQVEVESPSIQASWTRRGLRCAQAIFTLLELSPFNEAVRLAIWVGTGGVSHDPAVGALSYGVATLLVEATGVVAAAPLLQTPTSRRFTAFLNSKLARVRGKPGVLKLSRTTKVVAALFGGSIVAMALAQRESGMSISQLRLRGLKTTLWLTVVCAGQGGPVPVVGVGW